MVVGLGWWQLRRIMASEYPGAQAVEALTTVVAFYLMLFATVYFRMSVVSAGSFDEGRGETDDALAAVSHGRQRWPQAQVWLAGFSFGGVVALRASTTRGVGRLAKLVTVAPALGSNFGSVREISLPNCPWLVVQGDADEVIDGNLVIDWAQQLDPAPQLAVLPGVGHFFHGQLALLQDTVAEFLRG